MTGYINEQDVTEYKTMAWFTPFDTLKEYMLQPVFLDSHGGPDPALAKKAMALYAGAGKPDTKLNTQYNKAKEEMDKAGIEYFKESNSAIFFWLDLRQYLGKVPPSRANGFQLFPEINPQEEELENYLRDPAGEGSEPGVSLIPGTECFNAEPGYFRLCYTAVDEVTLIKAIQRLGELLDALK